MHSLSQDEKAKIYAVYVAIFNLPFKLRKKTTLLTALMGGADWSWRVTGITVGALAAVAAHNYKYVKGTICRAHVVARIDTAKAMFEILTGQNRYAVLYRIDTAKRADTRARRIEQYVAMLAAGETIYPQKRNAAT